jgi:hypothetical protein
MVLSKDNRVSKNRAFPSAILAESMALSDGEGVVTNAFKSGRDLHIHRHRIRPKKPKKQTVFLNIMA